MVQWNPREYRRSSSFQEGWARELIGKTCFSGSLRVLDIGCGDGRITAEIARALPCGTIIGIDSSQDMVKFAQEQFPTIEYPNLAFQASDMRALPWEDEFDLVFSNAAMHWVGEQQNVVEGISRSLKSGGRMIIQMGGKGNAADLFCVIDEVIAREHWKEYFYGFEFPYHFFDTHEYSLFLSHAGLIPGRVELLQKDMVHPDSESFFGWVRTTWMPYLERIPLSHQQDFIGQIYHAYISLHPPDKTGAIHIPMVRLEVDAKKP